MEFSDNNSEIATDDVKAPPLLHKLVLEDHAVSTLKSLLNNAAIADADETRRPRLHELSRHLVDMT